MPSTAGAAPPKTSKELANAVYDDFKRKAVDSAKKRAVAQGVDYETFCAMVSVAHLRPLGAEGSVAPPKEPAGWRFGADGSIIKASDPHYVEMAATPPTEPPTSSGDFQREWRRNLPSPDHKYSYLKLCGAPTLGAIFRVEVPGEVLAGIIGVLDTCWLSAAAALEVETGEGDGDPQRLALTEALFVVELLSSLSKTGRFSLTVRLLPPPVRGQLTTLFESLKEAAAVCEGEGDVTAEGGLSSARVSVLAAEFGVK